MIEFNIGDRVRSTRHNNTGVVEDKLFSNRQGVWLYTIRLDGACIPIYTPLTGDELEPVVDEKTYRYEITQAGNVMVAVMYEIDGDTEKEIHRAHGHIMHEGLIGVAQAASYAAKRIYVGMNDGNYISTEVF